MSYPTRRECLNLMQKYGVPDHVILHSLAVADVAMFLANRIAAQGNEVSADAVLSGALLHDVGKGRASVSLFPGVNHAEASYLVAQREGLSCVAQMARRHMLGSIMGGTNAPETIEDKLVWYADKTTLFRYLGLDGRFHDLTERHKQVSGGAAPMLLLAKHLEKSIFGLAGLDPVWATKIRSAVSRRPAGDLDAAIGTTYDYSVDIGTMMQHVATAGFRSVSLAGGKVEHSMYHTEPGRRRLMEICRDTRVAVSSVHAPFRHNMASSDVGEREAAVSGCVMACKAAADLGAPVVVVHPHGYMASATDEILRHSVASIHEILKVLPEGVRLAVENLPSPGTDQVLECILKQFPQDTVGFCYDSSHHNLRPKEVDLLGIFGERLLCVHISDNRGQEDDHQLPDEGTLDWSLFARRFGLTGFSGPFLLEVETRVSRYKESLEFVERSFDSAEWLLAQSDRLGRLW